MKICINCKQEKRFDEFKSKHDGSNRLSSYCKPCCVTLKREYRATDQGRKLQNEAVRKYRVKNRERLLVSEAKRRQTPAHKKYVREYHLQKTYGITLAEKDQMFLDQKGCCASCGDIFESVKATHTDHIHGTKIVRGLLCRNCNIALGLVKDDIKRLHALITYLERFSAHP
jgi:hypothetical protein